MSTLPLPHAIFPVEHRFADLDGGGHVHYVDEGRGETVLLLHGNPTWSFLYRKIIAELKSSYRCVAPDYPGYGLSQAPPGYGFTPREHSRVVEQLVDKLGLQDLTVMVQDWGGPIGLGLAGRRPELVRRFVIGNTFAWPLTDQRRMRVFSAIMGGPIGRAISFAFNGVVRFFMTHGVATKLPPEVLAMYLAPFQERSARRAVTIAPRQLIRAADYLAEVESGLARLVDRPALLVWGTKDFAFRETERQRFEALFPNHRTVLLEHASHFIQEDATTEIAAAFRAWRVEVP